MRQQVFLKPPPLCEDGGMPSMLRGYAAAIVAACLFYSRPQQPETREAPAPLCLQDISPAEAVDFKRKAVQLQQHKDPYVRAFQAALQLPGGPLAGQGSIFVCSDEQGMHFWRDFDRRHQRCIHGRPDGMPVARNVDFSGKKPPLNNVFTLAILIHSRGGDEEMYIVETLAKNRRLYPGEGKGCKTIGGN